MKFFNPIVYRFNSSFGGGDYLFADVACRRFGAVEPGEGIGIPSGSSAFKNVAFARIYPAMLVVPSSECLALVLSCAL